MITTQLSDPNKPKKGTKAQENLAENIMIFAIIFFAKHFCPFWSIFCSFGSMVDTKALF